MQKLTEINWLYKNVDDESVDEAAKQVVEVINNTSSTMLEKATKEDIDGFQAYTIRNLDNKLSTESDIDQYKVKNVQEDPLDNRQKYLVVMCFPVLFPTGHFGKYHPREVKLSHSEYVKSRLLNKDSRFRKDPQYVFYLLWQKEMRELSAGVYNVLKCTKSRPMSVSSLLNRVDNSDEGLEANLCTMLQSVRGTKQYWFIRQSELRCMIRGWGSPTIFMARRAIPMIAFPRVRCMFIFNRPLTRVCVVYVVKEVTSFRGARSINGRGAKRTRALALQTSRKKLCSIRRNWN